MNKENSNGLNAHPCFTPICDSKCVVRPSFVHTLELHLLYNILNVLINLVDTPILNNLIHKAFLLIEGKAALKSIKNAKTLPFFLCNSRSIIPLRTKILSTVE